MSELPNRVHDELERLRVTSVQREWPDVLDRAEAGRLQPKRHRRGRRGVLRTLAVVVAASALLAVPTISGALDNLLPWHNDGWLTVSGSVVDASGTVIAAVEVRAGSRLLVVNRGDGKRIRVFNPTNGGRPVFLPGWVWHIHFVEPPVDASVLLRVRGLARPLTVTLCRRCGQDAQGIFRSARVATSLARGRGEVVVTGDRPGSGRLTLRRGGG